MVEPRIGKNGQNSQIGDSNAGKSLGWPGIEIAKPFRILVNWYPGGRGTQGAQTGRIADTANDGGREMEKSCEMKPQERYAYYRRCQVFRRNGEQCKAPAMKGERLCYKHEQEAAAERRRENMRRCFALPPLVDLKTVQSGIREVGKAIIDGRIDEDYAGELLDRLHKASRMLRRLSL